MDPENEPRRSKRSVKRTQSSLQFSRYKTPPRLWNRLEKSKLLQALEMYDESDVAAISAFITTKSAEEVEQFIKSTKRKADMLSRRNPLVVELENWTKLLSKVSENEDARQFDHMTMPLLFISLFERHPHSTTCDGIDFKGAYEFIFCIMVGIRPKVSNQKTMEFISKSFVEMGLMIAQNTDLKNYVIVKVEETSSNGTEPLTDLLNPLNFPKLVLPISMHDCDDA